MQQLASLVNGHTNSRKPSRMRRRLTYWRVGHKFLRGSIYNRTYTLINLLSENEHNIYGARVCEYLNNVHTEQNEQTVVKSRYNNNNYVH